MSQEIFIIVHFLSHSCLHNGCVLCILVYTKENILKMKCTDAHKGECSCFVNVTKLYGMEKTLVNSDKYGTTYFLRFRNLHPGQITFILSPQKIHH